MWFLHLKLAKRTIMFTATMKLSSSKEKAEAVVEEIEAKGVDGFDGPNVANADKVRAMVRKDGSPISYLNIFI